MYHSVLQFFANVKYKCECGYVNENGYVYMMVNVKLDVIVDDITGLVVYLLRPKCKYECMTVFCTIFANVKYRCECGCVNMNYYVYMIVNVK